MIGTYAIEEYLTRVFNMDFVMAGDSEQTSLKLRFVSDNSILAISTIKRKGQLLISEGSTKSHWYSTNLINLFINYS